MSWGVLGLSPWDISDQFLSYPICILGPSLIFMVLRNPRANGPYTNERKDWYRGLSHKHIPQLLSPLSPGEEKLLFPVSSFPCRKFSCLEIFFDIFCNFRPEQREGLSTVQPIWGIISDNCDLWIYPGKEYLHLPVRALQVELLAVEMLTAQLLYVKLWNTCSIFNSTDGKPSHHTGVCVSVSGDALVALMFSREAALTQSLSFPPTLDF